MKRRTFLLSPLAAPLAGQNGQFFWVFESDDARVVIARTGEHGEKGYAIAMARMREYHACTHILAQVFYHKEEQHGDQTVTVSPYDYCIVPYAGFQEGTGGDRMLRLGGEPFLVVLTLLQQVGQMRVAQARERK